MALKKNVIVIKEDVEIAPRVFLSKGDTLVETSKGRWTIFEADDEEEDEKKEESDDSDEDDKVEESDDSDEDDEEEKKESAADDKKMAALRAKKK